MILEATLIVGMSAMAAIETPRYDVLEEREGYEIRQYHPQIVAEVTMTGEFKSAMNGGFRKLADFIFGNNTVAGGAEEPSKIAMTAPVIERKAIAMTAPVTGQESGKESHIVAFIMPSKYTLESLPKPNNPELTIRQESGRKYAVLQFSGFVPENKANGKKAELKALLTRDNLETVGEPILAQYDPPWTLPFMRRNEVWIEVK